MSSLADIRTLMATIRDLQGEITKGDLDHIKKELQAIRDKDAAKRTPAEQSKMEELTALLKEKMSLYTNTNAAMDSARRDVMEAIKGMIR